MRVAYRRDYIKLRNRRYNKAEGRVPTALIRLLRILFLYESAPYRLQQQLRHCKLRSMLLI